MLWELKQLWDCELGGWMLNWACRNCTTYDVIKNYVENQKNHEETEANKQMKIFIVK